MMKFLVLTLIFGLGSTLSTDNCPPRLRNDKHVSVYGNSCFKFFLSGSATPLDYFDAREACIKQNGTLALPKTKDINQFLANQLVQFKETKDTWIGLNDNEVEDDFNWEDNTPLGWDNFGAGEGHNNLIFLDDWEDCVAVTPKNGVWHDYHCETTLFGIVDERKPYVCQYPASYGSSTTVSPAGSVTCPIIECDLDCGLLGFKEDSAKCFVCECNL